MPGLPCALLMSLWCSIQDLTQQGVQVENDAVPIYDACNMSTTCATAVHVDNHMPAMPCALVMFLWCSIQGLVH
jgi:hypothetical protein